MKRNILKLGAVLVLAICSSAAYGHDINLHVNDKWKNCSMQLDPALTQKAWNQFTKEAGIMTVFNPLTSAKPLGKWNFEFGLSLSKYPIDDKDAAWNDTFVHPYDNHWLYGDNEEDQNPKDHADSPHSLSLPLMLARLGINERMDVGLYFFSATPDANYAFRGVQFQYNFFNDPEKDLTASVRLGAGQIFGVEDFDLRTYSVDVVANKDISRFSTYGGLSAYLASSRENTSAVNLDDENVFGLQGNLGVNTLFFSHLNVGVQLTVGALIFPSIIIGFSR